MTYLNQVPEKPRFDKSAYIVFGTIILIITLLATVLLLTRGIRDFDEYFDVKNNGYADKAYFHGEIETVDRGDITDYYVIYVFTDVNGETHEIRSDVFDDKAEALAYGESHSEMDIVTDGVKYVRADSSDTMHYVGYILSTLTVIALYFVFALTFKGWIKALRWERYAKSRQG